MGTHMGAAQMGTQMGTVSMASQMASQMGPTDVPVNERSMGPSMGQQRFGAARLSMLGRPPGGTTVGKSPPPVSVTIRPAGGPPHQTMTDKVVYAVQCSKFV